MPLRQVGQLQILEVKIEIFFVRERESELVFAFPGIARARLTAALFGTRDAVAFDILLVAPNNLIRVLKAEHQLHSFGEGVQVVLFKPNQEPRPFWLLKNFPKFDEERKDEYILTFEGFTEKEYTGLQVTKDPGVWVVWIGCGLMILGLILSFFFSHQRVWVRIPKSPGGEVVLAGSANKNRVGFEKTFGELAEEIRKRGSEPEVRR